MNEKLIERKLREEVKKMGGIALKFYSEYNTGYPDRIVLMPGGQIYFVELKSTGKKMSPTQVEMANKLIALGFKVYLIDDQKSLIDFLTEVERNSMGRCLIIQDISGEDMSRMSDVQLEELRPLWNQVGTVKYVHGTYNKEIK